MEINIVNQSTNPLPSYQTALSSGMDIRANLPEAPWYLYPGDRACIPTGLFIELPPDYEAQIRPRSGLALKKGITVLNAPGTIDADYRGEICVILYNTSKELFIVKHGERIAQMVIQPVTRVTFNEVNELSTTDRGEGGFGHTGTN